MLDILCQLLFIERCCWYSCVAALSIPNRHLTGQKLQNVEILLLLSKHGIGWSFELWYVKHGFPLLFIFSHPSYEARTRQLGETLSGSLTIKDPTWVVLSKTKWKMRNSLPSLCSLSWKGEVLQEALKEVWGWVSDKLLIHTAKCSLIGLSRLHGFLCMFVTFSFPLWLWNQLIALWAE